jgi:hypothetical protein
MVDTLVADGLSKAAIDSLFDDQAPTVSSNPKITEHSAGVLFAKAKAAAERFRVMSGILTTR